MTRRGPLVVGIAFGLVALLAIVLIVLPKRGEVRDAEETLAQERAREQPLQTELSHLQEAEQEAPTLRRELARFQRAVPPVADLPGLINDLQTAADVSGVDFFSVSPSTPAPASTGLATEIPASLRVIGGFFPIDEFLFRLETLPRAAKVVSVTLGEGPDGAPQVDVQLEVKFFTTDLEAGPGAPVPEAPGPNASPEPSVAPGQEPTPTLTPTPGA